MGILKTGRQGGKYLAFQDSNNNWVYVKVLDHIARKYIDPGYLTEDMLEQVAAGKTVTFSAEVNGVKADNITVKFAPYTRKDGTSTFILVFDNEPGQTDDYGILAANFEKIALSYWDDASSRFDWSKPQKCIDSLGLSHTWKTWSQSRRIGRKRYGIIEIKRPGARSKDKDLRTVYLEIENDKAKYLDETQYRASVKAEEDYEAEQAKIAEEERKAREEERKKKQAELDAVIKKYTDWEKDVKAQLDGKAYTDLVAALETLTAGRNPAGLETKKIELLNSKNKIDLFKYVFQYKSGQTWVYGSRYGRGHYEDKYSNIVGKYINMDHMEDSDVQACKDEVLDKLKIYLEYRKMRHVRNALWNQFEKEGIEEVVKGVDVDVALDIGRFKEIKKVLVKSKEPVKYIIWEMYKDDYDPDSLRVKLLNMLKVYEEFFDFPKKDRKAVAKFIATHKLKDYYETVQQFDDVLEYLDEIRSCTKDSKLLKPILNGVVGTSAASSLKSSTYYFELTGHLRNDIIVVKPLELLDRLRGIIKEYNVSSDVVVMTNIELDNDVKSVYSFTFQFYTFSDDIKGKKDFDGRRLQYMTKIYNQHYPNERISFYFDN